MRGPGRCLRPPPPPPAGNIAPQLFCFPQPVPAAEPRVPAPVAGPGAAGQRGRGDSSRLGARAEMASLLGAGRARRGHVQSCRARRGLEQVPGRAVLTARGPRERQGQTARVTGATAEIGSSQGWDSQGFLGRGLLSGFLELSVPGGRTRGDRTPRAAAGLRLSSPRAFWTCLSRPAS